MTSEEAKGEAIQNIIINLDMECVLLVWLL